MRLGTKNKYICFILLSAFTIFAYTYADAYCHILGE